MMVPIRMPACKPIVSLTVVLSILYKTHKPSIEELNRSFNFKWGNDKQTRQV